MKSLGKNILFDESWNDLNVLRMSRTKIEEDKPEA